MMERKRIAAFCNKSHALSLMYFSFPKWCLNLGIDPQQWLCNLWMPIINCFIECDESAGAGTFAAAINHETRGAITERLGSHEAREMSKIT